MASEILKHRPMTPELRLLIVPVADYIAATDDRATTLATILFGLIEETKVVDREAARQLKNGQH